MALIFLKGAEAETEDFAPALSTPKNIQSKIMQLEGLCFVRRAVMALVLRHRRPHRRCPRRRRHRHRPSRCRGPRHRPLHCPCHRRHHPRNASCRNLTLLCMIGFFCFCMGPNHGIFWSRLGSQSWLRAPMSIYSLMRNPASISQDFWQTHLTAEAMAGLQEIISTACCNTPLLAGLPFVTVLQRLHGFSHGFHRARSSRRCPGACFTFRGTPF